MPKPCDTCSATKCPKTENLSVKLWSMRTISSFRFVGESLPPTNCVPAVGFGKMPALTRAVAFGAIMHEGILLPGNGDPLTTPAGAVPPGQFPNRTLFATELGTRIGVELELKSPPYVAGSGTVWFVKPPLMYLRHSML